MAEPSSDRWKEFNFRNPLVWLGALVFVLLGLKALLPRHYVETLPLMLSAAGRCELARQQLFNPTDAAAVCEYGINSSSPEAQMFVAGVWFQHKAYGMPERDAEATRLFGLAEAQLLSQAERGDRDAQAQLGQLYSHSPLLDGRKAGKWLCTASKQGSSPGFNLMVTLQGKQMFKPLYEGPDAFTPMTPEEFRAACVPAPEVMEKFVPADPAVHNTPLLEVLCPYKKEKRDDGCDYRHYGSPF